jgi:hypothetical protein
MTETRQREERTFPGVGRLAVGFVALACLAAVLEAAVRQVYVLQNRPTAIAWPAESFPIVYALDRSSLLLADRSAEIARGFDRWVEPESSRVAFRPTEGFGLKAGRDGVNSVTAADGLFDGSGFIAFATTWFDDQGRILEGDIQVDPAMVGKIDLEAVIQHEVGHLLGLDHAGNLSSVVYPFIQEQAEPLSVHDRIGIAALYPLTGEQPSIRGEVRTLSGPLFGAQVVALNAGGEVTATTLSAADGSFQFDRLPAGAYRLYVEPLDGPVTRSHLSGIFRDGSIDFRTYFHTDPVQIATGRTAAVTLTVESGTQSLNPLWIGSFAPSSRDIQLTSRLARVAPGDLVNLAVGGDGFTSGLTRFELTAPGFERVSEFQYGPNYVYATFRVGSSAPAGAVSVKVESGLERAALTGAVRVGESNGSSSGRRRGARP